MVKVRKKRSESTKEKSSDHYELILYNDDFNTFDHVITTLVEVCAYDEISAEQVAIITHFKGKCAIKSGSYYELKPMCEEIGNRNLTCELE